MLGDMWNVHVQIFPVILTLLLVEIPGLTRLLFRIPYVPVYFVLFPFNVLNKDLSIYFNEDFFMGEGAALNADQLKQQRKEILKKAGFSFSISLGLTPFIAGFISAFFLPKTSLLGFLIILVAYKLIGIIRSAMDFQRHSQFGAKAIMLYIATYLVYFTAFIKLFHTSYAWTEPFVTSSNWLGLANNILDILVVDILFLSLIIGTIVTIIFSTIVDKKYRLPDEPPQPEEPSL